MEARQLLATFTVNSTLDTQAAIDDPSTTTLREAIQEANSRPGADNIVFSIPVLDPQDPSLDILGFNRSSQTWTIKPQSALPTITDQVTIDGYSQGHSPIPIFYPQQTSPDPFYITSSPNSVPAKQGNTAFGRVIVDGELTTGATGFEINASHSILRGFTIVGFDVGVKIPNKDNVGNLIQGNNIGGYFLSFVNPFTGDPLTGPAQIGFVRDGNLAQGVIIGGTNTTLGGIDPQASNVITGNGLQGVSILPGVEGNQILNNQIGIAGPSTNGRFVISGNGAEGVLVGAENLLLDMNGYVIKQALPFGASSNYIGGTAPGAGNLISANGLDGVHLVGINSTRINVKGNCIGLPPGGGFAYGSGDTGNLRDGVRIEGASFNLIGGSSTTDSNTISANEGAGIRIVDLYQSDASSELTVFRSYQNEAAGNTIGLTVDGISPLGNSLEGLVVESDGDQVANATVIPFGIQANNLIIKNIISANLRGVLLKGAGATGNLIQDNLIGTNTLGAADLGNANEGVRIEGSWDNIVQGNSTGSQVISGNNVGVLIIGSSSVRNKVFGNLIGTELTGTADLGNSQEGVRIEDAAFNSIGGTATSDRNLISANHWGVVITGPSALNNAVQGNFIGTDITGASPLGNELDGVFINHSASNNTVGGPSTPAGNSIAFNVRDGVRIEDVSVRNAILTNSIFSNGELGIDLVGSGDPPNGVTPNGTVSPGPNFFQNFPVLTSIATSLSFTNIQGTLSSTPNTTFVVQFFANNVPNPSGHGEGEIYLGQTTVTTAADGSASFSADVPAALGTDQSVTATATDPTGNTSEFSASLKEVLGSVQFQMASYVVDESAGTATITVVRSGGSGGRFTVDYATSDGTAIAGSDYQATSGTLTFETGQNSASFTIPIVDDTLPEANETILLTLSNPAGAAMLGTPSTAVLTILDNDQPGAFRFLNSAYFVDEAAGMATITVVRDSGGGTVSVNYATMDGTAQAGSDYLPVFGTLVFGPGETVKTFTVPIVLNPAIEGNEAVFLNLGSPTGGATLGSPSSSILVILDDRVDRIGPVVVGVQAIAGPVGVSSVVLAYSEPLEPTRAIDLLNYGFSVRIAGRDGRLGTRDDQLIGIRSATYDPASMTVRLSLTRPLAKKIAVQVEINKVTNVAGVNRGVADLAGNLLNSVGVGNPGVPYTAQVVARPSHLVVIQTGVKTPSPKPKKHSMPRAKPVAHPARSKTITAHPGSAKGRAQAQSIAIPLPRAKDRS